MTDSSSSSSSGSPLTPPVVSLEQLQGRLAAHERERKGLLHPRRRAELDRLIARDLADLVDWYRQRAPRAA